MLSVFEGRVYGVAFGNPASELWGLGPKTLSSGPVFGVLGSMDPVGGTDVMLVVARDLAAIFDCRNQAGGCQTYGPFGRLELKLPDPLQTLSRPARERCNRFRRMHESVPPPVMTYKGCMLFLKS